MLRDLRETQAMMEAMFHSVVRGVRMASICVIVMSTEATSQEADTLVTLLRSSSWSDRARAVSAIAADMPVLSPALSRAVGDLVRREIAARPTDVEAEDYSEYLLDVFIVAVRTGDGALVPTLIDLGAVGTSSGVSGFIASAGPAVIPRLDAYVVSSPDDGGAVLEVLALMYTRYASTLKAADSTVLLSRFIAAAASPRLTVRAMLADVAALIPLPSFKPLLDAMATRDSARFMPEGTYPVRDAAARASGLLSEAWNGMTAAQHVSALHRLQLAACAGATGELRGHCETMGAHVATLQRHLAEANATPAIAALENFVRAVNAARNLLAPNALLLLDVTADRVRSLLHA